MDRRKVFGVLAAALFLLPLAASAGKFTPPSSALRTPAEFQAYLKSLSPAQLSAFIVATRPATSITSTTSNTTNTPPAGLVACSSYTPNSVPLSLSAQVSPAAPGSTLQFKGTITNTNPYPIVNATIYAKVFYVNATSSALDSDVVDFFPIAGPLTLKAKESRAITLSWPIPSDAEPGSYRLATYVVASDRFDMQGIVSSDVAVGSAADFSVSGNDAGAVRFVKNSITVNGSSLLSPILLATTTIPISAAIKNSTAAPWSGTVSWKLYDGSVPSAAYLLDTKSEDVSVASGATSMASYTISDTSHSTYYLVAELSSPGGSKSVIDFRFAGAGASEPFFSFVGATSYPASSDAAAVACFQARGMNAAEGAVSIRATSAAWYAPLLNFFGLGTLASASYTGTIPNATFALAAPFNSAGANFNLTATLTQNGKMLDQVTIPYRCTMLAASCSENSFWAVLAVLALAIAILLYSRYGLKKKPPMPTTL